MKKSKVKALSFSVAFCMALSGPLASMAPLTAYAETLPERQEAEVSEDVPELQEENAVPEAGISPLSIQTPTNAIFDNWVNAAGKDAAVNEVFNNTWLHIKSGTENQHVSSVEGNPASVFINQDAAEFADGTVKVMIHAYSAPANTRTGVFTRYNEGKGVFVGYDAASGWFYQIYDGEKNPWDLSGVPAMKSGEQKTLSVTLTGNKMTASLDGKDLFGEVDITTLPDAGKFGLKVASWDTAASEVYFKDITYPNQELATVSGGAITGIVVDESSNPVSGAAVKIGSKSVQTGGDGVFRIEQRSGNYDLTVSKEDYKATVKKVIVADEDVNAGNIVLQAVKETTIKSSVMEVDVDEEFPRVIEYRYDNKVFQGQREGLNQVTINGVDVVPSITSVKEENKITYHMSVEVKGTTDAANDVTADITAVISVENNTLTFEITEISAKNGSILKTFEIKEHNLVSVNSSQKNARLDGTEKLSTNTHITGDHSVIVDDNLDISQEAKRGYLYAFVSNDELSAGLWSNSENKVNSDWQRVTATASVSQGKNVVGLSSTYWTYQKDKGYRAEDGSIEYTKGADSDGKTAITIDELPCAKVVIANDLNEDGTVNWQDGAIGYRDIMNNPLHYERVKDLAAYRICMNFGSQAQNPFLMTLDNVKKVYLNTDGLGQSILLKGYGSEGHDSGHLNYADIGTRIGGAEDMKTLLEKGADYGATFGIHVNASETYPESQYFSKEILKKNADGSYSYGWNWLDQGININADYDLRNGRVDRWKDLYDELGGSANKLDFIYVDVWGNGQSGDNGSWASRQLAKEITGLGWRLAGEWGFANEYDSTFQHWAADLTYGGYNSKGINSTIARFIRNDQKDSWVGNYPSYGGRAETPLLGGMNMKDFEGWQGRSDYAAYIKNLYEVNLSSKFIQHFKVTRWKDGNPVEMNDNGEKYSWTPGMEATLKATIQGKEMELVIKRLSNDYAEEKDKYRSREMTLDGRKIFSGQEGNEAYLIPWFWDAQGKELETEKLYHWNSKGGETTWKVPDGWTGNVKVYELNELGKQNETSLSISATGEVTINAKASTPYVIYLDGKVVKLKDITWSDGMHIVDSGFNSGSLDAWTIEGETTAASITKSNGSNPMLTFADNKKEVSVTQKLTGLKKKTKYAAYVGLDNRSSAKAVISVTAGGKTVSNSGGKSIARNYVSAYAHNTNKATSTVDGTSYFQNMYVFFETGNDGEATLTLSREAGSGATYFDDVRICENNAQNWAEWESEGKFTQDFENVAQGIYPFVVGNLEGVTDNRTHLAELHEPFTQRGWNQKVVDDVIKGKWSVKTNGLTGRQNLVYQTIPQNFMFEPGQSYMVQFDYEAGSDNTYSFVTGDGDYLENGVSLNIGLASTATNEAKGIKGEKKTFTFNIIGSEDGLGWFGIYSNDVAADTQGVSGGQATFNGYNDFMLDNLTIVKSESDKTKLKNLMDSVKDLVEDFYTTESLKVLKEALAKAENVYEALKATQKEVDDIYETLNAAIKGLKEIEYSKEALSKLIQECEKHVEADYSINGWTKFVISLNYAKAAVAEEKPHEGLLEKAYKELYLAEKELADDEGPAEEADGDNIPRDHYAVKAGSVQEGVQGEGLAEYAVDGDTGTIWHTNWSGSKRENLWFEFVLNSEETINGLRYMRRNGGGNGEIYKYDIQISTDGGTMYTSVATGDFEAKNGWQDVAFNDVAGATNVRLYATDSKSEGDGENKKEFASAAELSILGVKKENQAAPAGLKATLASKGKADGKITGVTADMEYSTVWNADYKSCNGTEISGLKAQDYYVRYSGTAKLNPGIPVKLTVFEKEASGGNNNSGNTGTITPSEPEETQKPETPEIPPTVEIVETEISSKTVAVSEKADGFYYDKDGNKVTEAIVKTEDGKRYILDEDGEKYVSAMVTVKSGNSYITNDDGGVVTGKIVAVNGERYYTTRATGKVVKAQLVKVSGKKYYASKDGSFTRGKIITIDGEKYYTTKGSGKVVQSKLLRLNGKKYYADKSGRLVTSKWVTVGNKKYYCNKNGVITKVKKK